MAIETLTTLTIEHCTITQVRVSYPAPEGASTSWEFECTRCAYSGTHLSEPEALIMLQTHECAELDLAAAGWEAVEEHALDQSWDED